MLSAIEVHAVVEPKTTSRGQSTLIMTVGLKLHTVAVLYAYVVQASLPDPWQ